MGGCAVKCMKCGREIAAEQVFCPECLADMEKHPIKPGTVVQLPVHLKETPLRKPQRRKSLTPDEQLRKSKALNRVLAGLLALTLAALLAVTSYLIWRMEEENVDILPGQNYSAEETTAPAPQ